MERNGEFSELDTSLLRSVLKGRFSDGSLREINDVILVPAEVNPSDGYSSETHTVNFVCTLTSGRKKSFTAFVKTKKNWKNSAQIARYDAYFRTEILFYTTVRPMMEVLLNEFGDHRDQLWPEYYGSESYRLLAIQDLQALKFTLAERRMGNGLDLEHSLLVLRSLGRFHAIAKTLIGRGLLSEDDVDKGQFRHPTDEALIAKWTALFQALSRSMACAWGEQWIEISEKLKACQDVTFKLCELASKYDKRFQVLNHGDVWGANLMFRYADFKNEPVTVKFIDFQMMYVNSFIWDVNTFLYMATIPSVRRSHRHALYEAYSQTLASNLYFFGFNGYIPTLEDVLAESDRIAFANMCFLIFGGVNNADCPVPMDMAKCLDGEPADAIDESVFAADKVKSTTAEDFIYFASQGVV